MKEIFTGNTIAFEITKNNQLMIHFDDDIIFTFEKEEAIKFSEYMNFHIKRLKKVANDEN